MSAFPLLSDISVYLNILKIERDHPFTNWTEIHKHLKARMHFEIYAYYLYYFIYKHQNVFVLLELLI